MEKRDILNNSCSERFFNNLNNNQRYLNNSKTQNNNIPNSLIKQKNNIPSMNYDSTQSNIPPTLPRFNGLGTNDSNGFMSSFSVSNQGYNGSTDYSKNHMYGNGSLRSHTLYPYRFSPYNTYSYLQNRVHTTKLRTDRKYWEDEKTDTFNIEYNNVTVSRRIDNNMINGTKLLNVTGMTRGKRDGILKNEKSRVVVKTGAMYLKGVWITLESAKLLAEKHGRNTRLTQSDDNAQYYKYGDFSNNIDKLDSVIFDHKASLPSLKTSDLYLSKLSDNALCYDDHNLYNVENNLNFVNRDAENNSADIKAFNYNNDYGYNSNIIYQNEIELNNMQNNRYVFNEGMGYGSNAEYQNTVKNKETYDSNDYKNEYRLMDTRVVYNKENNLSNKYDQSNEKMLLELSNYQNVPYNNSYVNNMTTEKHQEKIILSSAKNEFLLPNISSHFLNEASNNNPL
ncbi:hypothetical protein BB561_003132 [Smittium simulii]|uniref:HTH APSES-type domain-containing protein n=1 Tax=Smittium simulii TaxID=133385 RepID=A0A2T9YMT7_9FUNG|nr:hypothetical protein BB561_003132 [Smittium simulii]